MCSIIQVHHSTLWSLWNRHNIILSIVSEAFFLQIDGNNFAVCISCTCNPLAVLLVASTLCFLRSTGHYLLIEPDEVEEEAYNQELDEMNDDDVENDPMWVPDETPQIDQGKHTKASLRDLW